MRTHPRQTMTKVTKGAECMCGSAVALTFRRLALEAASEGDDLPSGLEQGADYRRALLARGGEYDDGLGRHCEMVSLGWLGWGCISYWQCSGSLNRVGWGVVRVAMPVLMVEREGLYTCCRAPVSWSWSRAYE